MHLYKAFYKSKVIELKAESAYDAQQKAAISMKAKKSYEVNVMLVAKDVDGVAVPVIHSTGSI